ncbi:ParA family protein [Paenibacillus barengoltzii]|uniref:ParA family protein n=1 Tax=Bacilli TaxID=91061 RepID=UPI003F88802D
MKIIAWVGIKGGIGKTTLAYNYGEWLAVKQGKKILFIDLDHQSNLSQSYDVYDQDGTVGCIFSGNGKVKIHHVGKNIDLIAGDMHLDDIETKIENNTNKNMLLYMWLADNYKSYSLEQYDYIIIDCHPDFSTATKNAIIVSHDVISPLTPSKFGYDAKFNLETRIAELKKEAIDYTSRKSYVTAHLWFVGNMLKHNTKSSRDLKAALEKNKRENADDSCIALIPERELFNKSTLEHKPIAKMAENPSVYNEQRKFFDEINTIFMTITKAL